MKDIEVKLETEKVDAGNLEETIKKLLDKKEKDEQNKHVSDDNFWGMSLRKQVEALSSLWTNPKSDGTGRLIYMWREEK